MICIHGGHAVIGSRGAVGYMDEVNIDRILTRIVTKYLNSHGLKAKNISVREGSSGDVLYELYHRSIKHRAIYNLSIHLNSGGGRGIEVYLPLSYRNTEKEDAWASAIASIARKTGFKNRGIKYNDRLFVTNNLKNCALIEVGFVDSPKDYNIYKRLGIEKIGKILARQLYKHFKNEIRRDKNEIK